jgi:hypothetical protein
MPMTHLARQTMIDKALADRERCRDWLAPLVANGQPKAFTKEQYREMARAELGDISKAAFDFAWICAIEQADRHDWYEPKPRNKETRQQDRGHGRMGDMTYTSARTDGPLSLG